MKRMTGLWFGTAICLVAATLAGWGGEPAPKPAPEKVKPAFKATDTNADGKVTCAEMSEAMCRDAFAKTEKNGDHVISWEEWAALDKAPGARERFDAMDANKDAKISFFEFSKTARKSANIDRTFSVLDKNGDGTLSQDEYSGHPHFKILSVQF